VRRSVVDGDHVGRAGAGVGAGRIAAVERVDDVADIVQHRTPTSVVERVSVGEHDDRLAATVCHSGKCAFVRHALGQPQRVGEAVPPVGVLPQPARRRHPCGVGVGIGQPGEAGGGRGDVADPLAVGVPIGGRRSGGLENSGRSIAWPIRLTCRCGA
jgi:hypothetical protein